jgi:hypothetical protein
MMDQKNYQQANNSCIIPLGIDGWQDDVIVVDLHPIMSHGWRISIPQRSHQNVLTHFSVKV